MSDECPVSAALTEDDKFWLWKIKRETEQKMPAARSSATPARK